MTSPTTPPQPEQSSPRAAGPAPARPTLPSPPERDRFLAAIVDSSDDAIVSKTLEGIVTSWNVGAARIFGYDPDEMIGQPILKLIPEERRHEEDDILARIRRGERIEHFETIRRRKDGSPVEVSVTVSPILGVGGEIVGASKIARDISERRHAERELADAMRRAEEGRTEAEILNSLARTLGAELDLDRLIQAVTDAATRLTGARFGAFFYNTVNDSGESYVLYTLSGVPREAFARFPMPRATDLFGPTFRGEGVIRIADVRKDPRYGRWGPHHGMPEGHLPVCSYLAIPVTSRSGDVLGGLFFGHPDCGVFTERSERLVTGVAAQAAISIDNARLYAAAQKEIAERRAAEDRERTARTQAERATRLRDHFLATVSHELRTPLNGMLGWTQLLRKSPDDVELRQQALDAIERGARSQARIIEDLLDMGRIISGKLRLDVQSIDLPSIVDAAIDTVRPALDAKGITLERAPAGDLGHIRGDPARLQQVVWNLLSNAAKFTPKGGRVAVRVDRAGDHAELTVADTGRGIAPEFLPHVFERFAQADSSTTRRHGGLGLGLAIVRHLVELHGGRVSVSSPGEGRGAEFKVMLPVAPPVHAAAPPAPAPSVGDEAGAPDDDATLAGVRVLVVDDDADSVEMLRRVLADRGASVAIATSARDALDLATSSPPEILVSDIGMPEMDGYELMRALRARGMAAPAVAMTAFARTEDRVRALRAGFNMHVPKPLEPGELIEVIAALVRAPEDRAARA